MNWSRKAVFPEHLSGEAPFFPLKEDGNPEGLSEFSAVVRSHLPVEEARPASIYLLVPEFDFLFRDTVVEEVEETGGGILSAGEGYNVFIVA